MLVALRLRALGQSSTQRLLWAGLVALAASVTLEVPRVAETLDGLICTNVAHLVKHILVVVAALAINEVVRNLALQPAAGREGRRRRVAFVVAAIALLIVLFLIAPVHDRHMPGFTAAASGEPLLLTYWATYIVALGATLVAVCRLTWHAIRTFPAGPLRASMWWIGIGATVGLAYCSHKAAFLVTSTITDADWLSPSTADRVQTLLMGTTLLALVVGVQWPAVSRWGPVRNLRAGRAYRLLGPLWRDYHEAAPEIALEPTVETNAVHPRREAEMHLYRRIIEIRDGMLDVRPYGRPEAHDLAVRTACDAGHNRPELIGEAAWLEVARRAKLHGSAPHHNSASAVIGGDDLDSESRVLLDIARSLDAIHAVADEVEIIIDDRTVAP